jgi:hypothetical protein
MPDNFARQWVNVIVNMFQEPQLFAQSGGESAGGGYASESCTSGEESFTSEVET